MGKGCLAFMKKTLVIIFTIVLCLALTGAAVALGGEGGIIKKDEATSAAETGKTNSAQKTDENTISAITPETLSAEDKALKAEIAKISDTKVDFRANKLQLFSGKDYNLKFLGMGANIGGVTADSTINTKITYSDAGNNTFVFDLKTGELKTVVIESTARYKNSNSITEEKALQIAQDYINKNFNAKYILDSIICNEQIGYIITFSKHICGYPTEDSIGFTIDFDGNICFMNAATGMFDKFKIESINESVLLEKLKNQVGANVNYTIDKQRLIVRDDAVYMECFVLVNTETHTSSWVYNIPVE